MRGRTAIALGAAVALAAACGGSPGQASKAGAGAQVRMLTIGTDDSPGLPAAGVIEEFARLAKEKSAGTLLIEPRWQAAGKGVDDWDQAVARMAVDGRLDMALIPARAWDTEGVTSMRALHAPFLVTSDALVDRVVTGEPAREMLAGLGAIGLTGLALIPENLRHPFGFGRALRSPRDFAGTKIRASRSDLAYALFRALGAEPDDYPGEALGKAIADRSLAGAESSFTWASTTFPAKAIGTGNVTLFPKVNSLVVKTTVLETLTARQRAALDQAAKETVQWGIEHRVSEADGARVYCQGGGTVVAADDADLRALERAAGPVYATLEADPPTKMMIERIRALKRAAPEVSTITPCGAWNAVTPSVRVDAQVRFPEGVYRAEMPLDFLVERGVNPCWARDNAGVSTLTFKDGTWRHNVQGVDCSGTYSTKGGRVTLSFAEDPCGTAGGYLFSAAWTFKDGELRFVNLVAGQFGEEALMNGLFGSKPWKRIG